MTRSVLIMGENGITVGGNTIYADINVITARGNVMFGNKVPSHLL